MNKTIQERAEEMFKKMFPSGHFSRENMMPAILSALQEATAESGKKIEQLKQDLAEETKIVNRIWAIFGNPTYKELKGKSIYDLINDTRSQLSQSQIECAAMRDAVINTETRTLPSGTEFTRNRCNLCHGYWDTGHPKRKDEKEYHNANCIIKALSTPSTTDYIKREDAWNEPVILEMEKHLKIAQQAYRYQRGGTKLECETRETPYDDALSDFTKLQKASQSQKGGQA